MNDYPESYRHKKIHNYLFVEHASSVERKHTAKKQVAILYAYWGGLILTEAQILERLTVASMRNDKP